MAAVFEKILEMSLTAAVVIVVVMAIRLLLRKAPRKYSYTLWSAAAFRLVCPVSFRSAFSIFRFADVVEGTEIIQTVTDPMPTVSQGYFSSGDTSAPLDIDPEYLFTYQVTTPVVEPEATANLLERAAEIAAVIWLVGLATLLIYGVVSYLHLRRRMSTAVLLEGNVWQSDRVQSPFILGFVRPKIYLPFGLTQEQHRYVLAHENYHLKRFDHIARPLSFLILAVHWFNPFVWLAYYVMGRDMEMSCDEKVLSKEDNIRKAYSTTLLSFAANRRFPSPSPLAFGESGVKGRIKNALNWRKPRIWVTIIAIVVCIVVIVVCAANPREVSPATERLHKWCSTETTETVDLARVYRNGHWEEQLLSAEEREKIAAFLNELSVENFEELENGQDWFYGDAELRIDTSWGELVYRHEQLFTFWINIEHGTTNGIYFWEIKDPEFMRYVAGVIGGYDTSLQYAQTPQEWAQAISTENVQWGELMINGEEQIYRSLSDEEIEGLILLINNNWASFSTPPKNSAWAFPTERMVTLCSGSIEYKLNLGPGPMSIICTDDRVDWQGEETWFFTSDAVKDFIRQMPEERALDENATLDWTAYVSVECVYQYPAVSMTVSDDSGKTYQIGENAVAILDKNDSDAGIFFAYPPAWRTLTAADWTQMFTGGSAPDLSGYENPRIRQLSGECALVDLDGTLWIVHLKKLSGIGYRVMLGYQLAPANETAAPPR